MAAPSFVLVIPVKVSHLGKSRLVGVPEHRRRRLAIAFACDTIEVALTLPDADVVVITDDVDVAASAQRGGATRLADPCPGDLNGGLTYAVGEARQDRPDATFVALLADLPALKPAELRGALDQAALVESACFVADSAGTGTTLYAATHAAFDPRFGPLSRAGHRAAGAIEIEGDLAGLRQDVDDQEDLARAIALGVGPMTRAVVGGPGGAESAYRGSTTPACRPASRPV